MLSSKDRKHYCHMSSLWKLLCIDTNKKSVACLWPARKRDFKKNLSFFKATFLTENACLLILSSKLSLCCKDIFPQYCVLYFCFVPVWEKRFSSTSPVITMCLLCKMRLCDCHWRLWVAFCGALSSSHFSPPFLEPFDDLSKQALPP